MNHEFIKAGLDDIIPFIVVVIFLIVRTVDFLAKQRVRENPANDTEPQSPASTPSTLEEFFQALAGEPKAPPPLPENFERPDYVQEMEEFSQQKAEELRAEALVAAELPETEPPVLPPIATVTTTIQKSSTRMQPSTALLSGAHGLKMPGGNPFRSSKQGGAAVPDLKSKKQLRNAMINHIVFSPPRAYDSSFDNTVAKKV